MATSSIVPTRDGIRWYVESQGSGPNLVLIPSGEGDCASFAKVARLLAPSFTVTTFDMPGMSRTTAPPASVKNVSGPLLASQIVSLLDALSIDVASFWGSSSGGTAALALAAHYPERVYAIIVHEVPFSLDEKPSALYDLPDNELVQACQELVGKGFNEDYAAWQGLGPEYHARLANNFVLWAREYVRTIPLFSITDEQLRQRPITWTRGSLSPAGAFADNEAIAARAGIPVSRLPCIHFPHVSIPDILAAHIKAAAQNV